MAGWFSKATQALRGGEADETPQPFEVTCDCNQKHVGIRRQRHQHIVCKECGVSLFVLPKDIYPEAAVKTEKSPDEKDDDESSSRPKGKKKVASEARRPRHPEAPEPEPEGIVEQKSKLFTPFRGIVVGILGLLGLTAFFVMRHRDQEDARRRFRTASEAGWKAMDTHEWTKAQENFHEAVSALEILGMDDPAARRVRKADQETFALGSLMLTPLIDMVEQAESSGGAAVQRAIQANRGRWVVIDAPVRFVDVPGKPGKKATVQAIVNLPWQIGSHSVEIQAESTAFEKIRQESEALFAGTFEDLKREGEQWVITLKPESSFLWCTRRTFVELGLGQDEPGRLNVALKNRLIRQTEATGLPRDNEPAEIPFGDDN